MTAPNQLHTNHQHTNYQVGDTVEVVSPVEMYGEKLVLGQHEIISKINNSFANQIVFLKGRTGSGWFGWRFKKVETPKVEITPAPSTVRSVSGVINLHDYLRTPEMKAFSKTPSAKAARAAGKRAAERLLKALRCCDRGVALECINDTPSGYSSSLIKGNTYYFNEYVDKDRLFIRLLGKEYKYPTYCFALKNNKPTKPTKTMTYHNYRDKTGRFTTKPTQTSFNTGKATAGASSKNSALTTTAGVPPVLRNGALYRVVGGPVGRLVGIVGTNKDIAVIRVHGKHQSFDKSRIRYADDDDVKAYLADTTK